MKTREFFYSLPEELIAQEPPKRRGESRLLILDKHTGSITHEQVKSLPRWLPANCVFIVLNNSRVRHARIFATSDTGGALELLMVEKVDQYRWKVITSKSKRQRVGKRITLEGGMTGLIAAIEAPYRLIDFDAPIDDSYLDAYGHIPLPPYIKREDTASDAERYQTVYARESGSAAAPTAGLHITNSILDEITERGVSLAYVTLHVGLGTFLPVRSENVEDHTMHKEHYSISAATAELVTEAKKTGRPVVAVGTTSVRTLESAWNDERLIAGEGSTGIFIYPGYRFNVVDSLLTNFHTPESSLLMLVSAFAGVDRVRNTYEKAIAERYRFFSYGDAMLIL